MVCEISQISNNIICTAAVVVTLHFHDGNSMFSLTNVPARNARIDILYQTLLLKLHDMQ